ncbi:MAG TPA: PEGA domain-containing protein [Nevskiaceae bacterium]|nr:PEGA domain-containing protein [Nevskiaceae bacterium]
MDFLDPKKQRKQTIRVFVGYGLITVALIMTTIVLLYQAYGFGLDKHGQVIQNGLVFMASQPDPAKIYMNGKLYKDQTDTRMVLPAGQYKFELTRDGYRTWQRAITVEGGSVEHFDYPFLFPTKLTTTTTKRYTTQPGNILQSPDRRWLLAQSTESLATFDVFDLDAKEVATSAKQITLPGNVLTATSGTQSWQLQEWSTDNRRVLLKHLYQKDKQDTFEYVLLDRQEPTQSINLTTTLGTNPTHIELRDKKYDQYYLYDQTAATLTTATLKEPAPQAYLDHVLAFKSHGSKVMLYATDQGAVQGRAVIRVRDGDKTYTIRQVASGSQYLLDLTEYSGSWYVAAGVSSEDKVYVYQDPVAALSGKPNDVLVPVSILKVPGANYLQFSDNARFIAAENADHFALYDAENDKSYGYQTKLPLDVPQAHATWMDGHRLTYVSKGRVVVFDFDSANKQTLSAANPAFAPLFARNYKFLYTIDAQAASGTSPAQTLLNSTSLLTPQDQ